MTQQYKVPQDVQREDRIIGPLTLKQMIILGIGGGIAYGIYVSLADTYFWEVWLPPVVIVSVITLAFTFLKIHNLPFHIFLTSFIEYKLLPHKRQWIQGADDPKVIQTKKKKKTKPKKIEKTKKKKSVEELTNILDSYGKK